MLSSVAVVLLVRGGVDRGGVGSKKGRGELSSGCLKQVTDAAR